MVRLSINPLLYAGALAAFGYAGFLAATEVQKPLANPTQRRAAVDRAFEEAIQRGRASAPLTNVGDYSKPSWTAFFDINLTGKPKPVEVDPQEQQQNEPPPPPPPSQTPIEEILTVIAILYDGDDPQGTTSVWIRYDSPDVQPPEDVLNALRAASGVPRDTSGSFGSMPLAPGQANAVIHDLQLGERLWKPFEHIELKRISKLGDSVFFIRHAEGKDPAELEEEEAFQNELDLPPEVVEAVATQRRKALLERQRGTTGGGDGGLNGPQAGSSGWVAGEQTREVAPNQFHIGANDYQEISRDPNRVFSEEVSFRSYSGDRGTRGLIVTKVSPRLARFGVQVGDVILSVNGQAVASQAQGVQVGKRLYRRGVRTFRVEVLSRGRKEVRTVTVPDK